MRTDVEPVRHGGDIFPAFGGSSTKANLKVRPYGDEQIQFALCRLNLSNINVEIAYGIGFELPLRRLVALDLRQSADVMALPCRSCPIVPPSIQRNGLHHQKPGSNT